MCDLMKYFRYLIVLIITIFCVSITTYACSTSDGCTGCYPESAAASCRSSLELQTKQQINDKCAGMSGSPYERCVSGIKDANKNGTGSKSGNNPYKDQGHSNNGGGGGSTNFDGMTDEAICQYCNGFNSDSNSNPTEEMKTKCAELGCPINQSSWQGNITYDNISYEDYDPDADNLTGCEKVFGAYSNGKFTNQKSLGYFLQTAFNIIKYIVPIILIVLTMVDFLKAVSSGDKDIVKVATNKLVKRAIIALVIFLIPSLLQLVLGLVTSYGTCGIK